MVRAGVGWAPDMIDIVSLAADVGSDVMEYGRHGGGPAHQTFSSGQKSQARCRPLSSYFPHFASTAFRVSTSRVWASRACAYQRTPTGLIDTVKT